MRLRVPPGCSAASHAGHAVPIDADGCVDVDENVALALSAHGFSLCELEAGCDRPQPHSIAPQVDDIDRLNRRGLFALLKARGVSVCLPVTNDELRALARRAMADNAPGPSDGENEGAR
jgi:hypothetical protein